MEREITIINVTINEEDGKVDAHKLKQAIKELLKDHENVQVQITQQDQPRGIF